MDLLAIIISILLPPLGVFLRVGLGKDFWINLILTFLGYIPGLVHAIWILAKRSDDCYHRPERRLPTPRYPRYYY